MGSIRSGSGAGLRLLATLGLALLAGGADDCDGSTTTAKEKEYPIGIDQSCDTAPNGVPQPGCGPVNSPGSTDPSSYSCSAAKAGFGFCGRCPTARPGEECGYCPNGTQCPADPCSHVCPRDTRACPAGYPIDCGDSNCCPNHHASCCGDGLCGSSSDACEQVEESSSEEPGPSGGLHCSRANACGSAVLEFCIHSGTSQCYYQVNGQRISCPDCQNVQGCAQQAANALMQYCH
jgi:hypothetical protein